MKLRLDLHGVVFEYERPKMPEHRFKALCLLAAAGMYSGMVIGTAALCGVPGLITLGVVTLLFAALEGI